jgi:hypothetical protein
MQVAGPIGMCRIEKKSPTSNVPLPPAELRSNTLSFLRKA